jgi:hypothetical protein
MENKLHFHKMLFVAERSYFIISGSLSYAKIGLEIGLNRGFSIQVGLIFLTISFKYHKPFID